MSLTTMGVTVCADHLEKSPSRCWRLKKLHPLLRSSVIVKSQGWNSETRDFSLRMRVHTVNGLELFMKTESSYGYVTGNYFMCFPNTTLFVFWKLTEITVCAVISSVLHIIAAFSEKINTMIRCHTIKSCSH